MKFLMMVLIGVLATFNVANAQVEFDHPNNPAKFYRGYEDAPRRVYRPKTVKRDAKRFPTQTARRVVRPQVAPKQAGPFHQEGLASFYWQGQRTANGEWFNPEDMTAAHRTLPFGSIVKVTARRSGKSVIVRINDRGPFIGGRIIDVSRAAARELGMISAGVAPVTVERIR